MARIRIIVKVIINKMRKPANLLTVCRIILSALILLFPPFSPMFYVLYISAGITDMLDGAVARKTNTASEFGSVLDTVADFLLVAVCMIRLLPVIAIPVWLWVWTVIIAAVKIVNAVSGFAVQGKPVAVHTAANRITGLLLFTFPLTLRIIETAFSAVVICTAATFAAIQKCYIIISGGSNDTHKNE